MIRIDAQKFIMERTSLIPVNLRISANNDLTSGRGLQPEKTRGLDSSYSYRDLPQRI